MPIITILKAVIAISVAAKFISTLVLLFSDKAARDRPGWVSMLWWTSKISPFVALPGFAWISFIEKDNNTVIFFCLLVLLAFIAVLIKVRRRSHRMERQQFVS